MTEFTYRCRMCKKEFAGSKDSDDVSTASYRILESFTDDVHVPMLSILHDCHRHQIGIADLIGCKADGANTLVHYETVSVNATTNT